MANMFDKARAEAEAAPAKKKPGKDVAEFQADQLEELASVKALMKLLKGIESTIEESVKSQATDHIVRLGTARCKRPDNFKFTDGQANSSVQFKKRSTASVPSDDELALLAKHNITVEKIVSQEETFVINPKYANDGDLLGKVAEAIEGIDGVPADFIQGQAEISKTVISEDALDEIFDRGLDAKATKELVDAVGVIALRVTTKQKDAKKLFDGVAKLLEDDE